MLKTLKKIRNAWRAYRAVKKAIDAIKKENTMPTTGGVATVPVKSAWFSKINVAQALSVLATVLALFGFDLSPEVQAQVLAAIASVTAVVTWVLRTWFNRTVTPE